MTGRRGFLMSLGGLAGLILVAPGAGASPPRDDAGRGIRTTIETRSGQVVKIEVLRVDRSGRSPAPVAQAGEVAVYVNNGGDGKTRTPPEVREAAEAFAKILSEKRLPHLPTFRERVIR